MERIRSVYEGDFAITGQSFRCRLRLAPIEEGELVICSYHLIFGDILTPREREVLALIGGVTGEDLAAEALGLEVSTIRTHVASIRRKLGVRSNAGMALAARSYCHHTP